MATPPQPSRKLPQYCPPACWHRIGKQRPSPLASEGPSLEEPSFAAGGASASEVLVTSPPPASEPEAPPAPEPEAPPAPDADAPPAPEPALPSWPDPALPSWPAT